MGLSLALLVVPYPGLAYPVLTAVTGAACVWAGKEVLARCKAPRGWEDAFARVGRALGADGSSDRARHPVIHQLGRALIVVGALATLGLDAYFDGNEPTSQVLALAVVGIVMLVVALTAALAGRAWINPAGGWIAAAGAVQLTVVNARRLVIHALDPSISVLQWYALAYIGYLVSSVELMMRATRTSSVADAGLGYLVCIRAATALQGIVLGRAADGAVVSSTVLPILGTIAMTAGLIMVFAISRSLAASSGEAPLVGVELSSASSTSSASSASELSSSRLSSMPARGSCSWARACSLCALAVAAIVVYGLGVIIPVFALYRGCPASHGPIAVHPPLPVFSTSNGGLPLNATMVHGSHNSFHLLPLPNWPGYSTGAEHWLYQHETLANQLAHGARAFELDVHMRGRSAAVFHIQLWDDQASCSCLVECLREMLEWSLAHEGHSPIFVQLELKIDLNVDIVQQMAGVGMDDLVAVEEMILSVWGNRVFRPDDLRGGYATLTEAVARAGWPSLDAMRSRIVFVLDDTGAVRETYAAGSSSLENRVMFTLTDGELDGRDDLAYAKFNDPQFGSLIASAARRGLMIRTRGDVNEDFTPAEKESPARLANALASGAHFISLDWFIVRKWTTATADGAVVAAAGCNANPGMGPTWPDRQCDVLSQL
ncbi:acid phosphatase [Thecamonas trahens ATCC 50062]|uniref:Acid phosphatase n=1 Tax=Thecamonas trahens ATCC 50062 TaxID=461836 RepID=A0A0L0DRA9_THETB|nr:acid phosphatase [Thecamonas trahens ATCC 50062]KNC54820.1 acid phosphatase [Thecamonas trahens ATCC 50062]|eukprot:XP_013761719.1 acid phosphatase [Thecamonas trahens ATCC 50062]